MELALAVVKGLVAWLVLMFIGTNFIGMAVGGLVHPLHGFSSDNAFVAREAAKGRRSAYVMSLFFCAVIAVYLLALWRYLNVGGALAAAMLMMARIPDLLKEMKSGERTTSANMSKGAVDVIATAMMWLALPVLCLSFY